MQQPEPSAYHHAHFMRKSIYHLKIYLPCYVFPRLLDMTWHFGMTLNRMIYDLTSLKLQSKVCAGTLCYLTPELMAFCYFMKKCPTQRRWSRGQLCNRPTGLYILHQENVILNQLQSSWVMKNLLSQSHKWMIMVAIQAFQSRYWFIGVTSPKPINLATESVQHQIKRVVQRYISHKWCCREDCNGCNRVN